MNYALWLQLLTTFATIVAEKDGEAPREILYLKALNDLVGLVDATEADLVELRTKYEAEVAEDLPTSVDELQQIIERITARGQRIQDA